MQVRTAPSCRRGGPTSRSVDRRVDEVRLTPWKDALREWYEPNLYHFAGAVTALWVYQCYGIFTRLMVTLGRAVGLRRLLCTCFIRSFRYRCAALSLHRHYRFNKSEL